MSPFLLDGHTSAHMKLVAPLKLSNGSFLGMRDRETVWLEEPWSFNIHQNMTSS